MGFMSLSPLSVVSTMVKLGEQQVAWKECWVEYWLKKLQESMDQGTGCHHITEILLKTVFNTMQSINLTCVENKAFETIVRKRENAGNKHFLLFPHNVLYSSQHKFQ